MTDHHCLTQTNKAFRKFEDAFEASILRIRRALQRDEQHEQTIFRGVQYQVSLLATIRANDGRRTIETIVHFHVIQWATER